MMPFRAALLVLLATLLSACIEEESSRAVGTLERDRLDLMAEASEPVVERNVEEGAFVEKGALLVRLDPTRLEAQVAQAASARARAEARLAELLRGPRKERVDEARAHLAAAEGRLATAQSELARTRELVTAGVATSGQLDERRATYDEAKGTRDAARATLAERLGGTTVEELAQAEASLAEAGAVLADVSVRRGRLDVRAPEAGWVDALPYEVGERPPAGGTVAVLLAGGAPYARVYVPASIRTHVRPGTPARVRVDGIEAPFPGRLRSVRTEASFTPFFALTEHDRGRLVYLAKVDLLDPRASELPAGIAVQVEFEPDGRQETESHDAHTTR